MDESSQLPELLEVLRSFTPTIPEELVDFYLQQAGFTTTDPRLLRLVALAAHKFLLDVTHDTMQYQRIRSQNAASSSAAGGTGAASALAAGATPSAPNGSANRTVLTLEDLSASLKEYGVTLCKPEYFSDVAHEM